MKSIKSFIITLGLTFLLTSCSQIENDKNTMQNTNVDAVPIEHIYDGYEELQGKDFGSFSLPDKIQVSDVDKLYSFSSVGKTVADVEQESKHYFKEFLGDSYDEANIKKEKEKVYAYYGENGYTMFFVECMPMNAYYVDHPGYACTETLGTYYADTDRDIVLDLAKGECTVGELCDSLSEVISRTFYPLYGDFEIYPYIIDYYFNENMEKVAEVTCAVRYKGVNMEIFFSPLFIVEEREEYQVITNYVPSHMIFALDGKDSITFFANRFAPKDEADAEEINEVISLKGAVELLEENLAVQSHYQFEEVYLYYCCKKTSPAHVNDEALNSKMDEDFKDVEPSRFEPTWCFMWHTSEGEGQYIKVNAVTGEITVEVG